MVLVWFFVFKDEKFELYFITLKLLENVKQISELYSFLSPQSSCSDNKKSITFVHHNKRAGYYETSDSKLSINALNQSLPFFQGINIMTIFDDYKQGYL